MIKLHPTIKKVRIRAYLKLNVFNEIMHKLPLSNKKIVFDLRCLAVEKIFYSSSQNNYRLTTFDDDVSSKI